jgi:CMP-N-acetylneuraminic acid synthetase
MAHTPRILGLIPARGGSKRLPRKNILPLAGKPLIAWTIEAALGSDSLDKVIVSTDDEEIASISRKYGAEVPFLRPQALASDTATGLDVMLHVLQSLAESGEHYDYLVNLQPTSPLRSPQDIRHALQLQREREADAVISVCQTDHPPEWSNTLPPDGSLQSFFHPGIRNTRSQDLPRSYRLNGAIYIFDCRRLLAQRSLDMDDKAYAYIMPRERSIDIDTDLDLRIAQAILEQATEVPA